jgi:hypothetical protein
VTSILDLVAEVRDQIIDKILAEDDVEFGLDVLLGKYGL